MKDGFFFFVGFTSETSLAELSSESPYDERATIQAPVRPLPIPIICGVDGVIFPPEETIMMIVYHTALRFIID